MADGGVAVAHRAFHHRKRPAERAVATSSIRSPAKEKVAIQAVLRFLRFQAPWAYGRRLFALLRRAPADTWANIRHRLMDAVEKWSVRGHSERVAIWNTRNWEM